MILLCVLLLIACYYDYRFRRIPNVLTAGLAISGVGWSAVTGGSMRMLPCLGGMLLLAALTYPVFRIGALGAGDVKLLGACAAYLPFSKLISFLFVSLLIAAIISLGKLLRYRLLRERFLRLTRYAAEAAATGRIGLYADSAERRRETGVCLAGPVLVGILFYLGGVY